MRPCLAVFLDGDAARISLPRMWVGRKIETPNGGAADVRAERSDRVNIASVSALLGAPHSGSALAIVEPSEPAVEQARELA